MQLILIFLKLLLLNFIWSKYFSDKSVIERKICKYIYSFNVLIKNYMTKLCHKFY